MKFIPFLAFHLTINNNVAITKITRKTPCTRTQEISWETLLNKGIKPSQILCYNLEEKDLHLQERTITQEGA
jgi:hypothetical protein